MDVNGGEEKMLVTRKYTVPELIKINDGFNGLMGLMQIVLNTLVLVVMELPDQVNIF